MNGQTDGRTTDDQKKLTLGSGELKTAEYFPKKGAGFNSLINHKWNTIEITFSSQYIYIRCT